GATPATRSFTLNQTVASVGLRASAPGSSSLSAPCVVSPGRPKLYITAVCPRCWNSCCGKASRTGSGVPTPTVSLAPSATYTIGGGLATGAAAVAWCEAGVQAVKPATRPAIASARRGITRGPRKIGDFGGAPPAQRLPNGRPGCSHPRHHPGRHRQQGRSRRCSHQKPDRQTAQVDPLQSLVDQVAVDGQRHRPRQSGPN